MSDIIHTERGTYDLSTTEGQWKYLCEFLAEKGARGTLWTSLNRLYESALKPDPRDELIRLYEEAVEKLLMVALPPSDVSGRRMWDEAKTALAQGAEIKKKMEEG